MSEAAVTGALTSDTAPGWFGKVPNLGDFVSRRLPDEFIRPWDEWLQLGLASARKDLGDGWLMRYLVAPVHRFWLSPGVVGSSAWTGVLMPSVDAVGRHFPLTIVAGIAQTDATRSLAQVLAAGAWFDSLDGAARQVLDIQFTADDLDAELSRLLPLGAHAHGSKEPRDIEPAATQPLGTAEALLVPFSDVARAGEASAVLPCSIWWCGDSNDSAHFACFASLPSPQSLAAFLTSSEFEAGDLAQGEGQTISDMPNSSSP
jgi:type VI secretion system ImpM family protein